MLIASQSQQAVRPRPAARGPTGSKHHHRPPQFPKARSTWPARIHQPIGQHITSAPIRIIRPPVDTNTTLQEPAPCPLAQEPAPNHSGLLTLAIGALGVVYGDIGTSPLYTIRECFSETIGVPLNEQNILGVLSLIFWSMTLVVTVKYLTFVLRADNKGEGGMLAMLALLAPPSPRGAKPPHYALTIFALFGSALLLADGVITPAISVLGAVEGLQVAAPTTPLMHHAVVPLTVVILVLLFLAQRHGTHNIARAFGPTMFTWFAALTIMGLVWIFKHPTVLSALGPHHCLRLFWQAPSMTFILLGAVVLCITGAEALYADLGHFGRRPIRLAWLALVMPALVINYFGQGALLLAHGDEVVHNPFYSMVYPALLYPTIALATVATIIASQALISGAFSLAQQATQLGYCPRLSVIHTSETIKGQIYVPQVNTLLMVACVGLVLGFRSSSNLAAAYGIAVVGAMTITSLLLFAVAREKWNWPLAPALAMLFLFMIIDIAFLTSNLTKIPEGGWFPLVAGLAGFVIMSTWFRGKELLNAPHFMPSMKLSLFLKDLDRNAPPRVKGTAVILTRNTDVVPSVLLHHYKHNQVLHERIVLMSVETQPQPRTPPEDRVRVTKLPHGFYQVNASHGFMEEPNVPQILAWCKPLGLDINPYEASYYLGRLTLLTTGRSRMMHWRKRLFAFLFQNERSATEFFSIPPNRVVELGRQVEM